LSLNYIKVSLKLCVNFSTLSQMCLMMGIFSAFCGWRSR
jgi:hypothetical protein